MNGKSRHFTALFLFGFFVLLGALHAGSGRASSVIYFDIALDESRNLVYGSDSVGNKIDLIDMESLAIVGSIPVGDDPRGLDVSPDGSELAVALFGAGEIAFINLDTLTVIASVPPAGTFGLNAPWDVLYGRPGRLYTSGNPDSSGLDYIHVFDTLTHTELGRSIEVMRAAPRLALTPDENTLYVSEVSFSPQKIYQFDVQTDTPVQTASGPHGPMAVNTMAISADAGKIYSSRGQIWTADLQTQLGSFADWGEEIAYAPGRNRFYVSGSFLSGKENYLFVYNADTYAQTWAYDLGEQTGAAKIDAAEENIYVSMAGGIAKVRIIEPGAYLPFVNSNLRLGIHGTVKYNTQPAAGISLELRFWNGANWSTRATTTTDGAGNFKFLNVPDLNANQQYYVRYLNDTDPSRIWTWHTALIGSYVGQNLDVGTFHIDDIVLTSPSSGASVSVPRTFTWNLRPGLPTDSYEFNLFDYSDGNPWFWTNPPLGYVGSYTLQGLPPGFATNYYYVWNMWVYDNLGGYGISYWARWVAFTNSGMASLQVPSASLEKLQDLEHYMLPQVAPPDR